MVLISKVYKVKDKLVIYLPFDLIKSLDVKEGDELDFLPYLERQYIVAKKADIAAMITRQPMQARPAAAQQPRQATSAPMLDQKEVAVLKKLNAIRYNERTKERIKQALNEEERRTLTGLLKRKVVAPFKKPGEQVYKYGISKVFYNAYLGSPQRQAQVQVQQPAAVQQRPRPMPQQIVQLPKKWEEQLTENQGYLKTLETDGFIVVANQAEATTISSELESSIRAGLVIGTRAFNKKYYIVLRSYVSKNTQRVLKALGPKATPVSEIANATGLDEEGVRAILYILAESGDVTETRKDSFRLVE